MDKSSALPPFLLGAQVQCSPGAGAGSPVLLARLWWGAAVCSSLTLDSTSGGSFARGHRKHSQHYFFHNQRAILTLTLFIPLSYSQLFQNLGRKEGS